MTDFFTEVFWLSYWITIWVCENKSSDYLQFANYSEMGKSVKIGLIIHMTGTKQLRTSFNFQIMNKSMNEFIAENCHCLITS